MQTFRRELEKLVVAVRTVLLLSMLGLAGLIGNLGLLGVLAPAEHEVVVAARDLQPGAALGPSDLVRPRAGPG